MGRCIDISERVRGAAKRIEVVSRADSSEVGYVDYLRGAPTVGWVAGPCEPQRTLAARLFPRKSPTSVGGSLLPGDDIRVVVRKCDAWKHVGECCAAGLSTADGGRRGAFELDVTLGEEAISYHVERDVSDYGISLTSDPSQTDAQVAVDKTVGGARVRKCWRREVSTLQLRLKLPTTF